MYKEFEEWVNNKATDRELWDKLNENVLEALSAYDDHSGLRNKLLTESKILLKKLNESPIINSLS